jgi:trypsin
MRRPAPAPVVTLALMLLSVAPAAAVNGGLLDDTAHPAVGLLIGSTDQSGCHGQVVGCSGVLIAPDVFLTSARCVEQFNEALATPGFITHVWVTFEPNDPFDCSQVTEVTSLTSNPAFNTGKTRGGDVGVARLAAPVAITPATLPPAADLFTLPRNQPYMVVAYGTEAGGNTLTLARRFAVARSLGFTSEVLALTFKLGGANSSCIGGVNEGGAVFVGSTDSIVALVTDDKGGCGANSTYQRLDVPSVRNFLDDFVTLP